MADGRAAWVPAGRAESSGGELGVNFCPSPWALLVPAGNVAAMPTPPSGGPSGLNRRELLRSLGFVGAAAALAGPVASWAATARRSQRLIAQAASIKPAGSDLEAIEHIVFLMMENRSYDHYFGAYPRGRGSTTTRSTRSACSPRTIPAAPTLVPGDGCCRSTSTHHGLESTDDLTHDWGPMHDCWNNGKMDSWVKVHTRQLGGANGALTMGYYTREDLPFHWALADHFTLCDATTARSSARRTPTG